MTLSVISPASKEYFNLDEQLYSVEEKDLLGFPQTVTVQKATCPVGFSGLTNFEQIPKNTYLVTKDWYGVLFENDRKLHPQYVVVLDHPGEGPREAVATEVKDDSGEVAYYHEVDRPVMYPLKYVTVIRPHVAA